MTPVEGKKIQDYSCLEERERDQLCFSISLQSGSDSARPGASDGHGAASRWAIHGRDPGALGRRSGELMQHVMTCSPSCCRACFPGYYLSRSQHGKSSLEGPGGGRKLGG